MAKRNIITDVYADALAVWAKGGGPRPHKRPDGITTRCDTNWMTAAERAITDAMYAVEKAGASEALTEAITLLAQARSKVADHVESS